MQVNVAGNIVGFAAFIRMKKSTISPGFHGVADSQPFRIPFKQFKGGKIFLRVLV